MQFNHFCGLRGAHRFIIISCIALIAFTPACSKKSADEATPAGAVHEIQNVPTTVQDQRQALLKQLQQLQGELAMMQGVVLKQYPELAKEQEDLKNLIEGKIQSLLKAQNVSLTRLGELQSKLRDQNVPAEEKKALMAEFQAKAKLVRQARTDVMKEATVVETFKQYESHLRERLIADQPQAAEKIAAFDKIQADLKALGNTAGAAAPAAPSNP